MRRPALNLAALVFLTAALAACSDPGPPPGGRVAELQRQDVRVGTGALARPGMDVTVHYTGWNYDQDA